jgi:hypothetical protein
LEIYWNGKPDRKSVYFFYQPEDERGWVSDFHGVREWFSSSGGMKTPKDNFFDSYDVCID